MEDRMSAWNEGAEQMVRSLWLDGMDAKRISDALAKIGVDVSRSAVLGKVHRMGLVRRASQARPVRGVRPKHLGKSVKAAAPKAPRVIAADKPHKSGAPTKGITATRFIDRSQSQCAMFCAGEEGALGYVCGAPALVGVYCVNCAQLIYVPTERQKREAA